MSHQNFVSDLVAMAKAFEELPQAHARIHELERVHEIDLDTIQRLELRLIERNNEIEAHLSTIRSLEVARDDAELRFLECDDAKSTLERVLQGIIGEAQGVLAAIAPVPEPATEPVHSTVVTGTANIDSQTNIPVGEAPLAEPKRAEVEYEVIVTPRDTYQGVKSDHPEQVDDPSLPPLPGQSATDPTVDMAIQFPPVNTETVVEPKNASGTASEGHRADPFPVSSNATPDTSTGPEASATSTATPSADATSPSDPEPVKYLNNDGSWYAPELNPAWVSWFNRQTGQ